MKKQVCMIAYTNYKSDARVRREAETLASTGEFEVTFLVLQEEDAPQSYQLENVNVIELNVRKYTGHNKINHLTSYIKFFFLAFFYCNRLLFSRKLDIVHVHNMPNFHVYAAILPRLFGKRIIIDIHDSTPETYFAKYEDNPNKFIFKVLCWEEALSCLFANRIICVNHVQKDKLVKRGIPAEKIVISINVADPKWFSAAAAVKNNRSGSGIKMIYHGTIARRLGIDLAIRAFAELERENPGMEFSILGYGEALNECIELSEELGLGNKVYFSRKILPLESMLNILKDMDIGIVANRKNSATELMLPVKLLEYVALNIPAIAPKLKTIEYYFTDEMVSYFEPGNIDSLIKALSDLCKDKAKRENQALKARAFLEQYGWEKHKMDLINMYREI